MNTVLKNLWSKLYNHPHATEEIVDVVHKDIKVAVAYGADKFTYTRNKILSTLTLLDMTLRMEERNKS